MSFRRSTRSYAPALVPAATAPASVLGPVLGLALGCLALGCDQAASESTLPALRGGEPDPLDRPEALVDGSAIEGRYELSIATMLDGSMQKIHRVRTDDGVYELVIDEPLAPIEYQSWVRVPGQALATTRDEVARWEADELVVVAPPPQPLIDAEARPPRRIGTVLVFWEGQGLNNGTATDSMYGDNESTNVYYGEISYGIETMAGKVFGPYQIEAPASCNQDVIAQRAEAAMIAKGHDPTQFTQMMFHFPGGLNCGWAGLANVGSPLNAARNSWYSGSFGCNVRNQELGHNYGMGHSHAYDCPAAPEGFDHAPYEDCEHVEYGHPYDPMGNGCGHMNVVQKAYMGWLDECNIVTATTSGTFNLLPIELPCNGTQALRFPSYDGRYYYLEYRNGAGDFLAGSGVLVNISDEIPVFGPAGYVLDELGENANGYLHAGDSFTDPNPAVPVEERAVFTVLEELDTHVVIQVTLPGGGDGQPPTCYDGSAPLDEAGAVGSLECAATPYPGDITPPTVQLVAPVDGQVFEPGSDFVITAEAEDDRGIIEVELYLDGEPFDVRTEPPWEWDATNVPAGIYEFGVIARDARQWTPSNAVTVQVGTPSETGGASGSSEGGGESGDTEAPLTGGPLDGTTGDDESSGSAGAVGGTLDDGCDCRAGGNRGGAGFAMLLLGLGWARRRRRAA